MATSTITYSTVAPTLSPPPPGYAPAVSGAQAEALAVNETPEATVISATGGLYSHHVTGSTGEQAGWVNIPAWVVAVKGICSPFWGPVPAAEGPRYSAVRYLVIDANSGAWIEDFD